MNEVRRSDERRRQEIRKKESLERGSLYRQIVSVAEEKLTSGENIKPDKDQKEIVKRQVVLIPSFAQFLDETITLQHIISKVGSSTTARITIESKVTPLSVGAEQSVFKAVLNPNIRGLSDDEVAIQGNSWGGFADNQMYENLLNSIQSWEVA